MGDGINHQLLHPFTLPFLYKLIIIEKRNIRSPVPCHPVRFFIHSVRHLIFQAAKIIHQGVIAK